MDDASRTAAIEIAISSSSDSMTGAAATMAALPQMAVPIPISMASLHLTLTNLDRYRVARTMAAMMNAAPASTRIPSIRRL